MVIKKANDEFYPPDNQYIVCTGLQRYVRKTPEINIFKDPDKK